MIQFGENYVREGSQIFKPILLGFPSRENLGERELIRAILLSWAGVGGYCFPKDINHLKQGAKAITL